MSIHAQGSAVRWITASEPWSRLTFISAIAYDIVGSLGVGGLSADSVTGLRLAGVRKHGHGIYLVQHLATCKHHASNMQAMPSPASGMLCGALVANSASAKARLYCLSASLRYSISLAWSGRGISLPLLASIVASGHTAYCRRRKNEHSLLCRPRPR